MPIISSYLHVPLFSYANTDPNHSYSDHHLLHHLRHLEEEAINKFVEEKGTLKVMHHMVNCLQYYLHSSYVVFVVMVRVHILWRGGEN